MKVAATAFVISTVAAATLTPLVRNAARRRGYVDHALASRKVHARPVPRLGGVAIVAAFCIGLAAMLLMDAEAARRMFADRAPVLGLLGGGFLIAAVGVVDDVRGLRARHKLLAQFLVAAVVYAAGYRIEQIANPFGAPFILGVFALPFTLLWIVGVINALNLIDGLDGLAGGIALIAVASIFCLSVFQGDGLLLLLTAALGGAVLGFLFFNFNPASIFMGDTGSMFLGFVLATTSIRAGYKSTTTVALLVPLVALALPIGDTLLAMGRRAARGVPMFVPDRGHIHHRLLDCGLSQRRAVLVLYAVSACLGVLSLVLYRATPVQTGVILVALSLGAVVLLHRLGYFDVARAQELLVQRRWNLGARTAIRKIGERLRRAETLREVWDATRAAAEPLGARAIALQAPELADSSLSEGFDEFEERDPALLRARFGLVAERPGERHLELGFSDGRDSVDRDTEILVELLCDHLSAALDRIGLRSPDAANVVDIFRKTA